MLHRKEFVSIRNYVVISIIHYCLWPFYLISKLVIRRGPVNNRILFIELGHMGDMLTTAAIIKIVKENRPDSKIICLCSPSAALALKFNPFVDEVIVMNSPTWYLKEEKNVLRKMLDSFLLFSSKLKQAKADTVVNVRATSYHLDHIAVWLSGAKQVIGFGNKGLDYLLSWAGDAPNHMPLPLQKLNLISNWLGLNNKRETIDPIFFSDENASIEKIFRDLDLQENDRIVGINPGAQHSFLWPETHFVSLCKAIHKQYDLKILFFGVPAQQSMVKRIQDALPFETYSCVGKTSLSEVFQLLKKIQLLITVDTGIRHLGNAANVPVIVLRSGAAGYDRYGKYAEHETVLINRVPCSPCGLEICPLPEMVCMTGIQPTTVLTTAMNMLDGLGIERRR